MKVTTQSWLALGVAAMIFAGCSGGSLTTREKGAGIGAVGGAAAGGLIGERWATLVQAQPSAAPLA